MLFLQILFLLILTGCFFYLLLIRILKLNYKIKKVNHVKKNISASTPKIINQSKKTEPRFRWDDIHNNKK